MEVKGKCVCLICIETAAVMKDYNVQPHDETKHQSDTSYTGAEPEQTVKQMAASLLAQQQSFFILTKHKKMPQSPDTRKLDSLPDTGNLPQRVTS